MSHKIYNADVVVIGAGIAGAWCALKLISSGIKTLLIYNDGKNQGEMQGSTVQAIGAINTAAMLENDFISYCNSIGGGQTNPTIASTLLRYLPAELDELQQFASLSTIKIGVKPDCSTKALLERILNAFLEKGGTMVKGCVTRLIVESYQCEGVQYESNEEMGLVLASTLVIASGGYAGLLGASLKNSGYGTIHGQFMRAGGILANMEFIFQHGFGQPDSGSLTPTEELQGAAITNRNGESIIWLEQAFFEGTGTKQHQKATEFWRNNRHETFFVHIGYRDLYKKIIELNDILLQANLEKAIEMSESIIAMFPVPEQQAIHQALSLALNESKSFDYNAYVQLRSKMPAVSKQRVCNIPYFSMGGIAHNHCRTNLHNVFVTGEAMHDFGSDRVGGLPWALYLCCASHIKEQILLDKQQLKAIVPERKIDFVNKLRKYDKAVLDAVFEIMRQHREEPFHVQTTEQSIQALRDLRKNIVLDVNTFSDAVDWTLISESILVSSLARKESRGCFYRDDLPNENPSLHKYFTVTKYIPDTNQVNASIVNENTYLSLK